MERVRRPKKVFGGFDNWSTLMLIGLFVVGVVLLVVDALLMTEFLLEPRGISLWGWFAKPTPTVGPIIQIAPIEGIPGTRINIAGQGWQANEPLVVDLVDPEGICTMEVAATPNADQTGHFGDAFAFPSGGCWAGLKEVSVIAHSLETGSSAAARFRVLALPQTPTPTLTWTPVVEPTVTATSTPVTEPTSTATSTPVVVPTSTPTPVTWPTATPTPAIVDWRGEYFDNAGLIGMATIVRNDKAVDFDWGYNAPAVGLPADGFSARWTRALSFEDGMYRFRAVVDDGIRLYVDGDLLIDQWLDGSRREVTGDRRLTAGRHTLRVEYYERTGTAVAQVRWEKIASYPDWKGEYWPNLNLQGNPAIVRNDAKLDFDWKQGSPGNPIPGDGFSARWTRQVALDAGAYRFHALVDDGVRLWINDRMAINAWTDQSAREYVTDWTLAKGTYTLKVEYYERVGNARIYVWWEKMDASYPDWKGEYWPNRTLSGDIALLRNDREINFDWGAGGPASGLPADSFSARWTRQASFDAAVYRFHVLADDGIRLWVDGQLLIDKWQDQHPTEYKADLNMVRGAHRVKVEYYEHTGGAQAKVWWEKVAVTYPDWKGEYWPNRDLSGSPTLVRNDKAVDFNWSTGAPATGLPVDNLSVRWTRQVTFQPGIYRFYAWADDGIRAAVDSQWIINEWHDATEQVYSADLSLSTAPHQVTVEYYERAGKAGVRFWWNRVGDLPTPVPVSKAQFSSAVYTVDEGAGTATITVLLSAASDHTVTVDYATAGGTAAPGSDYSSANGTLTFVPGLTSRTFTVGIVDDTADEVDETVVLVLSNPVNAQLGALYQAALIITDNDEPPLPEVRFSATTYSVDEGAGTVTITVVLSSESGRTVSVDYATSDGTANAGSDYAAANGTLIFGPGVTSQTFAVTIVDDGADEEDETVALTLSSPTNAVLGAHSAVLAIIDDDTTAPPASSVRLNEILPVPGGTDWDRDGTVDELDEWIELYNAGTAPVDLSGWLLDDADGSDPYQIPTRTVLDPGTFLVLYRQKTGIILDNGGDMVRLLDTSGREVDTVTFSEVGADTSYNRSESGNWYTSALPSPGALNAAPLP